MKMKKMLMAALMAAGFYAAPATAQHFSPQELAQGYRVANDTVYFVFDDERYDRQPSRVVVTGSFRSWSNDMHDKQWHLQRASATLWKLAVYNPNLEKVPARSEFKFRINEGEWLSPLSGTPNEKGGNLVFLKDVKPPTLKAEIRKPRTIWAKVEGFDRPLNAKDYRLTDSRGTEIPVASVMPNTASETLITPAIDLDIRRPYFLEIPAKKLKIHCSYDGWFREIYSTKELGANISSDGKQTAFRIFSPRAELVKLYLYKNPDDKTAYKTIDMVRDTDGVWETIANENLKGVYYDFTVHGAKEPGNHFYESHPVHITDPYARVSMDTWGKCRVWERTKPATPLKNGIPKMQDVIAYEVHVQDFTDRLPVSDDLKGTLPAMIKPGLRNSKGEKVGFDYLVDLGVNTIHLMPVQEFLNWKDEDWKASFENDPYMKENGINTENYDWGYRTSHYFAVEARFRQKGTEPGAERNQFRDLVQAFHDKGIAVIIDIVPNHTAENMDGQSMLFNFNALDKIYYYRTRNLEHIGEYGNEVKTENRPMVQRWLIDQCKHFIEEFGIDGFRIDLAGQMDQQTLIALKKALGDDIIIYGEPWIGSNDPEFEANPDWDWYKEDSPITFFQDDSRNSFKGPVSNPENKKTDRGYAGGNFELRDKVKLGLADRFPEDKTPLSGINYLDIHDNWALADQFATKDWDGRFGVDEDNFKIAAVLLYTSQGPIVTHGGTEMMRSKGAAVLKEVVKETKGGVKVYLHGKRDTYNMRTANQYVWENVGKTKGEKDVYADYKGMYAFWQGLNRLRLGSYGSVFRNATAVPDGYYRWIEPQNKAQLGYFINDRVFVLINVDEKANTFSGVRLPEGNWKLVGNNSGVNEQGVKDDNAGLTRLKGGSVQDFVLQGRAFKIWVRE